MPLDNNKIDHPAHYMDGGIETIDYIKAKCMKDNGYMGYLRGNALKYLSRAGIKDDTIQDLKKVLWFVNKMISELEVNNEDIINQSKK